MSHENIIFNTFFDPRTVDADLVRINFQEQRVEMYKDDKVTTYYPDGKKTMENIKKHG